MAGKKRSQSGESTYLKGVNKTRIPASQLQRYANEVHKLKPSERDFEGVAIVAARVFKGSPDLAVSAYFRMSALAKLISGGRLPGLTKDSRKKGAIMIHPALLDVAGQAPLHFKDDDFVFNRTTFLKRALQIAKRTE